MYSDYVIYVDESGDHSLVSVDKDFPVFVLDFCIFHKDIYARDVVPRLQEFKFRYFGHDVVILHEHTIRKQKAPFVFLKSETKRMAFMEDLNAIIREVDFKIVASVIKKHGLMQQYADPDNPYDIALRFCMERAYAFLKDRGQDAQRTHIIVERRGKQEDDALELAFRRIRDGSNRWGPMPGFEIVFADKKTNSSGLQLADLTARPIGRHILDPAQKNRAYEIVEAKFRRSPSGAKIGWGLKVFP